MIIGGSIATAPFDIAEMPLKFRTNLDFATFRIKEGVGFFTGFDDDVDVMRQLLVCVERRDLGADGASCQVGRCGAVVS